MFCRALIVNMSSLYLSGGPLMGQLKRKSVRKPLRRTSASTDDSTRSHEDRMFASGHPTKWDNHIRAIHMKERPFVGCATKHSRIRALFKCIFVRTRLLCTCPAG